MIANISYQKIYLNISFWYTEQRMCFCRQTDNHDKIKTLSVYECTLEMPRERAEGMLVVYYYYCYVLITACKNMINVPIEFRCVRINQIGNNFKSFFVQFSIYPHGHFKTETRQIDGISYSKTSVIYKWFIIPSGGQLYLFVQCISTKANAVGSGCKYWHYRRSKILCAPGFLFKYIWLGKCKVFVRILHRVMKWNLSRKHNGRWWR